jgi:hypothetical protein
MSNVGEQDGMSNDWMNCSRNQSHNRNRSPAVTELSSREIVVWLAKSSSRKRSATILTRPSLRSVSWSF